MTTERLSTNTANNCCFYEGPVLLRSPGNMLIFWISCGSLLPLLVLCYNGKGRCTIQENKQYHVSPVLESLRCYNDYSSYVRCSWEESPHASSQALLALYYWDDTENSESPCKPYGQPALNAKNGKLAAQCQYNTRDFGINTNHVFFFKTSCPPAMLLSKNLRVRPPVHLSQQPVERGGRLLSWESPYPPTSLLTPTLNYQVNYRRSNQDDWTVVKVQDTQLSLEPEAQVPGCQYEAKVRAKGKTGLWSEWSSLVTWMTEDDPVPGPSSAQCVVDDEKVVTCSWEVKRDLAQFLTFHLSCKRNHTAPAQKCCVNTMVSAPSRGPMLKYSCSFPVPDSEQLEVELIPTCNSKTFKTHKNIRPNRPLHVQIEARDGNWILKWNPPKSNFELTYQVHYWSNDTQEDTRFLNVSQGSLSLSILGGSLRPSECYLVKVRALVVPGRGDTFEGPPSEWTDPVEWTSQPASWSITTFFYVFISVLVAIVFITLYVTIPACHRRLVLWEVSVPSPLKSKALGEVIKKSPDRLLFPESERSENTYICSVQTLESREDIRLCFSCSLDNPLWLTPDVKANELFHSITKEEWKKYDPNFSSILLLSVDRSCPPALDSSGFSFSGPYILCGDSSPAPSEFLSLEPPCEESDNTLSNSDPSSPSSSERSAPSPLESSEGYVAMPQVSAGLSRSTTDDSKNIGNNNSNNVVIMAWPKSELLPPQPSSMSTCSPPSENEDPPPAYMPTTTTPFTLPPVDPTLHTSGYCFLPALQALGGWGHVQSSGPPKGGSQEQQAGRRERRQEEQCKEDPYVRLSQLAT
ncbi:interleukin-3 receptor class 2 subunit beta isoform X1 [Oncorhynchus nerka]|uniref:interleukin-3 receptor class 2 subunit beta isoform X1 n=2 Tax=Oncorhynchus nerka TaxID=8023 RepID=UPI00113290EA|nr:cytokine receptor common subunit beta isoform X1 [Oncorhynchus nerka]